jgi:purine nucleosidase/pyrimidine-specific ribonucleoside hydrolase
MGTQLSSGSAVNAIIAKLEGSADASVDFVALGPLTNVARLIDEAPTGLLERKFRFMWVMGGVLDHSLGNSGPGNKSELNFYADPEAARLVLASPLAGKLRLVGLDVCNALDPRSTEWASAIVQASGSGLGILSSMQAAESGTFTYDPVVAYLALHEGKGVEFVQEHVAVGEFGEITRVAAGAAGASPEPLHIATAFPDREVYFHWLLEVCEGN